MIRDRWNPVLIAPALMVLVLLTMGRSASAGWFGHSCKHGPDPFEGYAVPLENVVQFPAAFVFQPGGQILSTLPPPGWPLAAPFGVPTPAPCLSYDRPRPDALPPTPGTSTPPPVRQAEAAPRAIR